MRQVMKLGGRARVCVWALGLMLAMGAAACGEEAADTTKAGAPVLEWISGGEISLSALVGETNTAAIGFRNGGDKVLDFELSLESEWLAITPLDGKVEPGGEQELTLSATCPEEAGVYSAGVALQSNAPPGGHILVVQLNCTELPKPPIGALTVTVTGLPEGIAANIGVSGPDFEATLNETRTLQDLVPGEYTLTASSITVGQAIYGVAPDEIVITIEDGEAAVAEFAYELVLTELDVSIIGLPDGLMADVTVTGPGEFEARLDESATLQELFPGTYEVTANPVADGVAQYSAAPITVVASSNDGAVAEVNYELVLSSLEVTISGLPDGVDADVTVTNEDGFSEHLTEAGTLLNLVPGEYQVNVETVEADTATYVGAGFAVSVTSSEPATASVTYVASGGLAVTITGLPVSLDADVTLTNDDGFTQVLTTTTTLSHLMPGDYNVSALSVTDPLGNVFTAPDLANVVIESDEIATLLVEYTDPALVTTNANTGPGSLRSVVANVNSGTQIHFAPGLVQIILTGAEISLDKDLILAGPGPGELEISGNNNSRIFSIEDNAEVTIQGLTLTNGSANNGGAIAVSGTLHVEDCAFVSNVTSGGGGALYQLAGTLTVIDCDFHDNSARFGGAIYTSVSLSVMGSTFDSNSASLYGGAIANRIETFIHTSSFTNNVAGTSGGAINLNGYSNNFDSPTSMSIEQCVFAGNQAGRGGAIHVGAATDVTNSTFTNNQAEGTGGAIYNFEGRDTYINVTVIGNTAGLQGGGIYHYGDAVTWTRVGRSIIADNTANEGLDVFGRQTVTPFQSWGYNIIGDSTGSLGWADGVDNDQVGTTESPFDPDVLGLADNGGASDTMALGAESPARYAVPAEACLDIEDLPLLVDQRGFERPQDGMCSIGAFEPQE